MFKVSYLYNVLGFSYCFGEKSCYQSFVYYKWNVNMEGPVFDGDHSCSESFMWSANYVYCGSSLSYR